MPELNPEKKLGGILAPLFAVRGKDDLGVGDTETAKELATWTAQQGLGVLQILPINETGSDHSPYNLLSAMALEPSTIATRPKVLPDLRLKDYTEITARHDLVALRKGAVNYVAVNKLKRELLYAAFKNFRAKGGDQQRIKAFARFERENEDWLPDYSLHRALVSWNDDSEVSTEWPIKYRSPQSARVWMESLDTTPKRQVLDLIRFHAYVQWIAYEQWLSVRLHCERVGVALMGDVPVGVSVYSADVWKDPEIFDLTRSSGAPPEKVFKSDPFTEQWGQNWGFPLYNWKRMAEDDFVWWRKRLRTLMRIFHLLRVDHALGFFRIYSFPWRPSENERFTSLTAEQAQEITGGPLPGFVDFDDSTDENREQNRLHGEALLKMMVSETGQHRLIAEDLGELAPYVRPTLEQQAIPGFKIPQWERIGDRLIPGSEYQRLSLATFATHDHPPVKTHWTELYLVSQSEDKACRDVAIHSMWEFMEYCGHGDIQLPQPYTDEIHQIFLKGLFAANSWLAVHMITDLLGTEERFNVPGSAGSFNWTERLPQPVAKWNSLWKETLGTVRQALTDTDRMAK